MTDSIGDLITLGSPTGSGKTLTYILGGITEVIQSCMIDCIRNQSENML